MEGLLSAALMACLPLVFAALAGALSEKSGVVNLGVEGMLLSGALAGAWATFWSGSPYWGLMAALLAGLMAGFLMGVLCGLRGGDPIVCGLALNLAALGVTGVLYRWAFGRTGTALVLPTLPWGFFLGLALLLLLGSHIFLHRTSWGLVLRTAGEKPEAAQALGWSTGRLRFWALVAGGGIAGLGGASLSLCLSNTFIEGMSAGRGFVALAIVILGRAEPLGLALASILFGGVWALQFRLQAWGLTTAYQFFLMAPYIATLLALMALNWAARRR